MQTRVLQKFWSLHFSAFILQLLAQLMLDYFGWLCSSFWKFLPKKVRNFCFGNFCNVSTCFGLFWIPIWICSGILQSFDRSDSTVHKGSWRQAKMQLHANEGMQLSANMLCKCPNLTYTSHTCKYVSISCDCKSQSLSHQNFLFHGMRLHRTFIFIVCKHVWSSRVWALELWSSCGSVTYHLKPCQQQLQPGPWRSM